ncbi:MAG: hypothetical protein F4X60_03185 [Gemmatimonadetes bacterium]|nr:hypothetical protein [Gemmatimonadota bacterium]MYB97548.1 hypothetical protein [Gemmatimonadota bacterium]
MNGAGGNGRGLPVGDEARIDPQQGYAFMKAHRDEFPVLAMCRALGLSPSGYYDWLKRASSEDARRGGDASDGVPDDPARERWEVRMTRGGEWSASPARKLP